MAPRDRARLADVARLAGVSLTTASHTFSGRRPVSNRTRRSVLEAAFELGYSGGTLRREPVIGLLIRPPEAIPGLAFGTTSLAGETGATVLALLGKGFSVTAMNDLDDVGEQLGFFDGFVLLAPHRADPALQLLEARGIPTVTYEEPIDVEGFEWWVGNDFARSCSRVVAHLLDGGARHIAFVAGQTDNAYIRSVTTGYLDSVRRAGLRPVLRRADNSLGTLAGRQVAAALLGSPNPPDAIVTTSAVFATGVLEAAADLGVEVPCDLMVAATMDGPLAEHARVPVTALRSNANDLAQSVATLMARRLTGEDAPTTHDKVVLELAERRSTRRVRP